MKTDKIRRACDLLIEVMNAPDFREEDANVNILKAIVKAGARDGEAYVDAVGRIVTERDAFDARCGVLSMQVDDLSRTVAAMGERLKATRDQLNDEVEGRHWAGDCVDGDGHECSTHQVINAADAILSGPDVTAERDRWVSTEAHDEAFMDGVHTANETIAALEAERDAAIARAEKAEADLAIEYANAQEAEDNESAAERARDELGIQLAAQSERLRLIESVLADVRPAVGSFDHATVDAARAALKRLDAVPGDALATSTKKGADTRNPLWTPTMTLMGKWLGQMLYVVDAPISDEQRSTFSHQLGLAFVDLDGANDQDAVTARFMKKLMDIPPPARVHVWPGFDPPECWGVMSRAQFDTVRLSMVPPKKLIDIDPRVDE